MKRRSLLWGGSAVAVAGVCGTWSSLAASASVVRFGQSASLTGGQAGYGRDVRDGIAAAFAAASKTSGTRFELVTLDDGGVRSRTAQNVATLIDLGVTGLIGLTSGAGAEACIPAVEKAQIALLGTASGNMGIRADGVSSAFHVRAGYDLEYQRMVAYARDFGMRRIGVVYLEDTSKANLDAMNLSLHSMSITPKVSVGIDRNMSSFDAVSAKLLEAKLDFVLFTANAAPVSAIIDQMTAARYPGLFYASSFAGQDLVDALVAKKQSCVMSMVVPRPNATTFSVVNRCQQDLAALGGARMGMTTLEGYIAGRIAVEAALNVLKNGSMTRPKLRESLAALRADVGGYKVEFGGGTQGSKYVDLVAIDRYGRMVG
ncbi:ABC transporter substrate-binding protein [Piscinibacter sp. XHJ-5]|uniref:ABC transporter substrate-binding protein n=1 Tax=Piscinibacter sp. XHJ-5 TaxID=3037797 RepID=UPI0024535943|nr:ABC transporter substrate-binding protein [Piscinibacter sp. XHJ-5]